MGNRYKKSDIDFKDKDKDKGEEGFDKPKEKKSVIKKKSTAIQILMDASDSKEELHSFMDEMQQMLGKEEKPKSNWIREWFEKSKVPQSRGDNIEMKQLMGILEE